MESNPDDSAYSLDSLMENENKENVDSTKQIPTWDKFLQKYLHENAFIIYFTERQSFVVLKNTYSFEIIKSLCNDEILKMIKTKIIQNFIEDTSYNKIGNILTLDNEYLIRTEEKTLITDRISVDIIRNIKPKGNENGIHMKEMTSGLKVDEFLRRRIAKSGQHPKAGLVKFENIPLRQSISNDQFNLQLTSKALSIEICSNSDLLIDKNKFQAKIEEMTCKKYTNRLKIQLDSSPAGKSSVNIPLHLINYTTDYQTIANLTHFFTTDKMKDKPFSQFIRLKADSNVNTYIKQLIRLHFKNSKLSQVIANVHAKAKKMYEKNVINEEQMSKIEVASVNSNPDFEMLYKDILTKFSLKNRNEKLMKVIDSSYNLLKDFCAILTSVYKSLLNEKEAIQNRYDPILVFYKKQKEKLSNLISSLQRDCENMNPQIPKNKDILARLSSFHDRKVKENEAFSSVIRAFTQMTLSITEKIEILAKDHQILKDSMEIYTKKKNDSDGNIYSSSQWEVMNITHNQLQFISSVQEVANKENEDKSSTLIQDTQSISFCEKKKIKVLLELKKREIKDLKEKLRKLPFKKQSEAQEKQVHEEPKKNENLIIYLRMILWIILILLLFLNISRLV